VFDRRSADGGVQYSDQSVMVLDADCGRVSVWFGESADANHEEAHGMFDRAADRGRSHGDPTGLVAERHLGSFAAPACDAGEYEDVRSVGSVDV
jgi:hypothetical protein